MHLILVTSRVQGRYYADDILLYKPINSDEDRKLLQSRDCHSILEWITQHGLTPNHSKTKLLCLSQCRGVVPINLNIAGHHIPPSAPPSVKYLGVTLSSNLTQSEHVKSLCKTAKCQLRSIHRKLHFAPTDIRRQLLSATVLPVCIVSLCVCWHPNEFGRSQETVA